jgi:hypothetical protein
MGADLITATIVIPDDVAFDPAKASAKFRASAPEEILWGHVSSESGRFYYLVDNYLAEHSEVEPALDRPVPADLRDAYLEEIDTMLVMMGEVLDGGRHSNFYPIPGFIVGVIGGTSWGESPGEDFETVVDFWEADAAIGGLLSKATGLVGIDDIPRIAKLGTSEQIFTPAEPRTPAQVVAAAGALNDLTGHVALDPVEILWHLSPDELNDAFSIAMTGSASGLLDISWRVVGTTEDELVVYGVTGNVNVGEFGWPETAA